MGKGWKQAGMLANAQKRGRLFTKLAREISVAAKMGGPDPEANARLQRAIEAARVESCPKDTIERAIKRGAGLLDDGAEIEEVTFEGYGPHGVGVMVECQTDNRNRTVPEIRSLFKSHGGNMGESGSVAWMFERIGLIEGQKEGEFDPEEEAIEAGANEVFKNEDGSTTFYSEATELDSTSKALQSRGWKIDKAELSYKATNLAEVTEEQRSEVLKLLEALDDHDDSHRVYANLPD